MLGLEKGPETGRWTDFRSELKKLWAGVALSAALLIGNPTPATAQAQAPEKQTPPTEQVEKQKVPDYLKEWENLVMTYYRGYFQYFNGIFRAIAEFSTKEEQKLLRKKLDQNIKDWVMLEVINNDEQKAIFILGFIEGLVNQVHLRKSQQLQEINSDLYDIIDFWFEDKEVSSIIKNIEKKIREQTKRNQERIVLLKKRDAELDKKIKELDEQEAELDKKIKKLDEQEAKIDKKIEEQNNILKEQNKTLKEQQQQIDKQLSVLEEEIKRITKLPLETFLKDNKLQAYVLKYIALCKKLKRTPIKEVQELEKILNKQKKKE